MLSFAKDPRLCKDKKIKCFRTAQLHIHQKLNKAFMALGHKRAFPAFFRLCASLTVEAAFVLPVFIFMSCILIFPIKVLDSQAMLQARLEKITEVIAAGEYVKIQAAELLKNGEDSDGDGKALLEAAEKVYSVYDIIKETDGDVLGFPVITCFETPEEKNGEMVKVKVLCSVRFPFTETLPFTGTLIRMVSSRRAWVGRKGGAGRSFAKEQADEETDDGQTVWVARNASVSGRYHLSSECHYISNTVSAVPAPSVADMRNADGGRYHPCPSCGPKTTGTVYIFKSGDAYHGSTSCPAIASYAETTTKKEAEERGLSPCSYCLRKY